MKPIILTIFLLTNTVYAFDSLRGAGSSSKVVQEEQSYLDKAKHWYKSLIGKSQDKPKTTQSDDVIIINSDRSITFNGKTIKLGSHINEWIKVIGNDYRTIGTRKSAYVWDNLGISMSVRSDKGDDIEARITKSFTIQLITYNEMFPNDKKTTINRKDMGAVKEFYFKGLVQIEDGYLSRETSFEEFRKSDVGRIKFENTFSRPSKYSIGYYKYRPYQFIYIDLTHNRFIKRISFSIGMTQEEFDKRAFERKAKKQLEK